MHYVYMFQNYMRYSSFENATSAVYERQVAKVSNFSLYYFFSSFFIQTKARQQDSGRAWCQMPEQKLTYAQQRPCSTSD